MNFRKMMIKLLGVVVFVGCFSLQAMNERQRGKRVSFSVSGEDCGKLQKPGSSKLTDKAISSVNSVKKEKNSSRFSSNQNINEKIWREKKQQNAVIVNTPHSCTKSSLLSDPKKVSIIDVDEDAIFEIVWQKNSFIVQKPKSSIKPRMFSGSGNYDFDLMVEKSSDVVCGYNNIMNSNNDSTNSIDDSSSFAETMRLADKIIQAQSQMFLQQQTDLYDF